MPEYAQPPKQLKSDFYINTTIPPNPKGFREWLDTSLSDITSLMHNISKKYSPEGREADYYVVVEIGTGATEVYDSRSAFHTAYSNGRQRRRKIVFQVSEAMYNDPCCLNYFLALDGILEPAEPVAKPKIQSASLSLHN